MPKLLKRRKDTGILPNGMQESERDRLSKRDWTKPAAKPEHNPDNWTTADCVKAKFSGIRVNRLNGMTEIWITGEVRARGKTKVVGNNPNLLATMMEEATQTVGSIIEIDVKHGKPIRSKVPR